MKKFVFVLLAVLAVAPVSAYSPCPGCWPCVAITQPAPAPIMDEPLGQIPPPFKKAPVPVAYMPGPDCNPCAV